MQVDAVVVGADRVVANGDTANKIGTHNLSILASHHNIPFFIAAPTTTLDPSLPHGGRILIEQRSTEEITHYKGQRVAAEGIQVRQEGSGQAAGQMSPWTPKPTHSVSLTCPSHLACHLSPVPHLPPSPGLPPIPRTGLYEPLVHTSPTPVPL